jgi:isovaleryl-CoA dehydrogenase
VPEQYGGAGLDLFASRTGVPGLRRAGTTPGAVVGGARQPVRQQHLPQRQRGSARRYLPGLCSGKKIGALGLTEPGAGSDALGSMRTTARRDGDHYVLNGTKIYITNGPVADVLLVYAKTDKERGAHGISAFIVEKDFPGFSVAQKLIKMGFAAARRASWCSRTAACRPPTWWARRTTA